MGSSAVSLTCHAKLSPNFLPNGLSSRLDRWLALSQVAFSSYVLHELTVVLQRRYFLINYVVTEKYTRSRKRGNACLWDQKTTHTCVLGPNSGYQDWWQVTPLIEPTCQPDYGFVCFYFVSSFSCVFVSLSTSANWCKKLWPALMVLKRSKDSLCLRLFSGYSDSKSF